MFSPSIQPMEDDMAYKKMDDSLGFAHLALESSRKNNRSIKNMRKLEKAIDWSRIDSILMSHFIQSVPQIKALMLTLFLLHSVLLLFAPFFVPSEGVSIISMDYLSLFKSHVHWR